MEFLLPILLITDKVFQNQTFYPTEKRDTTVGKTVHNTVFGWILYSHPQDGGTCGPSCIYLGTPLISCLYRSLTNFQCSGIAEGSNVGGGISDRWGPKTDGYSCRISVDYISSVDWGKRSHVAPPTKTLQLLSSFLVGNGSKYAETYHTEDIPVNQKWLTPWGVGRIYPRDPNPPAMGFAGILARAVAIATQRLGDGLDKEEILPTVLTAAGLLSVSWKWVAVVLGVLAVVQVVIVVIATFLARGSLDLADDLDLLDGLLASHRFPGRSEPDRVADKPWIKRVATSSSASASGGEAELIYRFKGGTWGRLGAGDAGKQFR